MLTLIGENLLRSYAAGPGILVDNGAKLTISGENTETLEVYGAQMEYYSDQATLPADSPAVLPASADRTLRAAHIRIPEKSSSTAEKLTLMALASVRESAEETTDPAERLRSTAVS